MSALRPKRLLAPRIRELLEFDDFILLAVVFQFQGLLVEVYRGIRVVVQLQVDLVAHATLHVQVDFLVEVKSEGLPAVRGQ